LALRQNEIQAEITEADEEVANLREYVESLDAKVAQYNKLVEAALVAANRVSPRECSQ
jgi:hypothetical protein